MSGDYIGQPFWFKAKKAARYVRLYGLSRTWVKVRGQYHNRSAEGFKGKWVNPRCRSPGAARRSIAIIGCGNYAYSAIAYYLKKLDSRFLRATYDVNPARSRSLCSAYGGYYATDRWEDILNDPLVNLVFIASNHASHAVYAEKCIAAGKHVHIEKPHVVSEAQLTTLMSAVRFNPGSKVFLGFNRPRSPLFQKLKAILGSELGPLMINWFVAGHEIPDGHWYFDEKEGGRVLGNLCHWTDLTLHLVTMERAFPCMIVPATPSGAKSDFVVSIIFADQSCATITFSAKGHTFEGVREILNVHKGNVLATLTDFHSLTWERVEEKLRDVLLHRDHGHGENISVSWRGTEGGPGESPEYIEMTALFFLGIKSAIDSGEIVRLP